MDTTNFEDVLREACGEAGEDADHLTTQEFMAWRRFASRRLDAAWRHHYWPDLGRCEQRWFRLPYNPAQTYAAAMAGVDNSANEVYWALTGQYFCALTAVPANTPPTDGSGNVNLNYWAVTQAYAIQPDPVGTEYNQPVANVLPFDPTVAYNQGAMVQYTNNVYQLFALQSAPGDLPTDGTAWGLVPAFDAYIPYEQSGQTAFTVVESVWSANPKVTTRGNELNWWLSDKGIQVMTPMAYAWVQYRIRCPKLGGMPFRADVAYAAGAQVYFSSAACPGNFYTAVTATNAGDTPVAQPAEWAVVAIPRIFHRYLVLGMAADWEKDLSGQNEAGRAAAMAAQAIAADELDEVKSLYVGQMGQRVKTIVRTR